MPKLILERAQPDSVYEFRRAAHERFQDACGLADSGRRTGAIYLWGYVVELLLKGAYFEVIGFAPTKIIRMADLHVARHAARNLRNWRNLHDLEGWAEFLVHTRSRSARLNYPDPQFARVLYARARQLDTIWRESLRYRKNMAYNFELSRARESAEWFICNARHL